MGSTVSTARARPSTTTTSATRKSINLHRGWPNTSLLPITGLQKAAQAALSDPELLTPSSALMYGPDPGYQELREALAVWLGDFYTNPIHDIPSASPTSTTTTTTTTSPAIIQDASTITITGGASQSLANILASFTDPSYTRAAWMIAPAYFLACPIMADAGFTEKMRAVPEDAEGVDLAFLRAELEKMDEQHGGSAPRERPQYKDPNPHRKIYRHIIYCVPTFSNPSGKTMSLRRRIGLVELAREFDALVVCDDVYDMLQWSTTPPSTTNSTTVTGKAGGEGELDFNRALLPRLVDIDLSLGPSKFDISPPQQHSPSASASKKSLTDASGLPINPSAANKHFGHVVSNGSFSKLAGPGLRTGWTQSSPDFALGLSQTGATRSGGAPSQMTAAIVCALLKSGDLQSRIETVLRPKYRERHRLLMGAVQKELVEKFGVVVGEGQLLEFAGTKEQSGGERDGASQQGRESQGVFGGYFIWLTLPSQTPEGKSFPCAKAIAAQCMRDADLVIGHGGMFEVQGDEDAVRLDYAIRLCLAWEEEENLVAGVERLGKVIGSMLDEGEDSWEVVDGERGDSVSEQK